MKRLSDEEVQHVLELLADYWRWRFRITGYKHAVTVEARRCQIAYQALEQAAAMLEDDDD